MTKHLNTKCLQKQILKAKTDLALVHEELKSIKRDIQVNKERVSSIVPTVSDTNVTTYTDEVNPIIMVDTLFVRDIKSLGDPTIVRNLDLGNGEESKEPIERNTFDGNVELGSGHTTQGAVNSAE